MASQASVSSSQPDQRQLRLIAASAQANESRVRDILEEDPPWTTAADLDALRLALQKVSARGKLSVVRLLLDHGAEVNARKDRESPALVKAAEGGHMTVVEELLARGANLDWRSASGQTALFSACLKGKDNIVRLLVGKGANVNAKDNEERTPLLCLAAEKVAKWKWTINTFRILLENGAAVDAKDKLDRTSLLWCATNNHIGLAELLLASQANVAATNNRSRTALHLASENNHHELAAMLLRFGADPSAVSDGGWQALHNAAQSGHLEMAKLLLNANANVNAQLSNGMTPLHWSASNGHQDIVELLLTRSEINLAVRDCFDRTPMLAAAEQGHAAIVQRLSPARNADRLPPAATAACKAFEAHVVDFGQFEKRQLVSKPSVYDVLYGWDHEHDRPKVTTAVKHIKYKPDFRWIHLPTNNVSNPHAVAQVCRY
jgi:ankyrin repeat protein